MNYTYKVYIHNILIKNGLKKYISYDTCASALLTFINGGTLRILVDKVMYRYNNPNILSVSQEELQIINLQESHLINKLLVNACILENNKEIRHLKNLVFTPNEFIGSHEIISSHEIKNNEKKKGGLSKEVNKTDFISDISNIIDDIDEIQLERLKPLIEFEEKRKANNTKRMGEYKKVRKILEKYSDYKNKALLDCRIKRITEQLGIKEVDKHFLNAVKHYYYPIYEFQN